MPIGPELAIELKGMMAARGFYPGSSTTVGTTAIQRRLELFLGSENYDNRIENGGLFDLEVLADLRRRYGPTPRDRRRVVLGGAPVSSRSPSRMSARPSGVVSFERQPTIPEGTR